MNYICKNCGEFVSEKKYKEEKSLEDAGLGCGCFIWLIIILCFVSIILIPIAVILILQLHKGDDKISCPYCGSKGSLIPENSPVAQKIITENFTQEQKDKIKEVHDEQIIETAKKEELDNKNRSIGMGCLIPIVIIAILMQIFPSDDYSPQLPENLKCISFKNLCIATTDVKYDYTSVQSKDPRYYNSTWNNGWASAQNACKAWGGRLPYMEEFPIILEAYFAKKIKLEDNRTYLSATEINWHRIYAFSNSWVVSSDKTYNKNNIYNFAVSIPKSADWNISGEYNTSTVYDFPARCVKPIK